MSILLLTTDYTPLIGGVSMYAARLVEGLRAEGCDVRVVTTVPGPDEAGVLRLKGPGRGKIVKIAPLVRAGIREGRRMRPRLILATVWGHEGIAAAIVARRLGIPYSIMAHGTEIIRREGGPARAVMTRVFTRADLVVTNSVFTRGVVSALGVDPARIVVVNPPISIDELDGAAAPLPAGLEGKRVLLTASRLARRKGHTETIRALGLLKDKMPDVVYVLTGRGPMADELVRLARAEGLAERVIPLGFVSREALVALYRRCDAYVSPSLNDAGDVEGFGIALAEASACGRPVIAGRTGGVVDAVVDGETGLLVDGHDIAALAAAIARVLEDALLARRLGEAGSARARDRFTPRHAARTLLSALPTQVMA